MSLLVTARVGSDIVENIPEQIHCRWVSVVESASWSRGVANSIHSFLVSPHVPEQRHLPWGPHRIPTSHGEIEAVRIKSSVFGAWRVSRQRAVVVILYGRRSFV